MAKKTVRLLCSVCGRETNHTLRDSYKSSWSDDESGVGGGETNDFLMCNGCEAATLRTKSWFSEEPEPSIALYPPRGSKGVAREPKDFDEMTYGGPLDSVYRQIISAFNQRLFTLAGAGVRLAIEGVCKEKAIKDGPEKKGATKRASDLRGRINGLAEKGFISEQHADILHEIRFLGNDAAHELDQPSPKIVATALDIIEHLLEQVFEQPAKAKALAARKRPPKK
jgi:hypothetical protein